MINLLLSIIASVLIGNLLMLFMQDVKSDIFIIFLGNYITATAFSLAKTSGGFHLLTPFDIGLGCITGLFFLVNFLIYRKNIGVNGLSLSVGVMRISLIIPTLLAILLFSERIELSNYLGIGVILLAFVFVTETRTLHNLLWIGLLFVVTGISDASLKMFDEWGTGPQEWFVFLIFASAGVWNLGLIFLRKSRFQWRSLGYGLILGVPNQLTTRFFLASLEDVQAAIAYPLMASGVVVMTILTDILFWRKRFSGKQRISMALIVAGIVLLNIQR